MVVELGDPVYRAAVVMLRRTLPVSESGRWCVVVDEGGLLTSYGPFGAEKAVDVGASLTSDHAARIDAGVLGVRLAAWVADVPS